jgi:hypothetical protein
LQAVVVREVDRSCEPGALNDDFNEETFDEDDGNGDGTHDMDDMSEGLEDDEVDVALADENDFTSGPSTSDNVLENEYRFEPSSDDESDGCQGGFLDVIGVIADGSLRMEYNDIELRQLKAAHVKIPSIPNFMDISMVDQAICDTSLTLLANEIADSEEVEIKKGMVFDTMEHLKYFLMDYVIRFHRPYYVTHSDKNKRYTVLCKNGYQWGLWDRS